MKVIDNGSSLQIYGDDLKVYNFLDPKVYNVRFEKMRGFFLEPKTSFSIGEEKVYGVHEEKINKTFKRFIESKRSIGAILSGAKGIGKSLFSRMLTMKCLENGFPVINVDTYYPGIADYLDKITQECMILFDEYDKTFVNGNSSNDTNDPQTEMLGLFDGTTTNKKLFVITCNNLNRLSDFIVNRTGRFHFHFRFDYPSSEQIKEYLQDKVKKEYWKEIPNVINFARKVDLNYDSLRSIAIELNDGLSFKEAIKDLNIINTEDEKYNITIHFENAKPLVMKNERIDIFNDEIEIHPEDDDYDEPFIFSFDPKLAKYSPVKDELVIDKEFIKTKYDDYQISEEKMARIKTYILSNITIEKTRSKNLHYMI